ncbi:MAG: undecaprenyl-diphosphate phosphatase [Bacillota bacterium]|jgi:undecaprenyl-diphosphatase
MDFIEILKVILIGIVEGITEWLPISSTGHMILIEEFIKLNVTDEFMKMFLVVIQLGAILAVVWLYFHKLNPFSKRKTTIQKKDTLAIWGRVIVGCIPAVILGFLLDDWLSDHFYNYTTVAVTLILYGVFFILLENRNQTRDFSVKDFNQMSLGKAFAIGCFQCLSMIPGTSRSGSTILGAMLLGVNRKISAEFSFFMAIPIMFGASLLKLLKFGFSFTGAEILTLAIGMITAFVVSVIAIKFLMSYIQKKDFKAFGYYRIVLGALVLLYFLIFA